MRDQEVWKRGADRTQVEGLGETEEMDEEKRRRE